MNELLDLHPRQWNLLILPNGSRHRLLMAVAYVARQQPVIVLDCGRQFDSSIVARAAGGQSGIIGRIQVQRAFICYEAVKLLERTPTGNMPILVLDFLSTFYDENVKAHTRKFFRADRAAGTNAVIQYDIGGEGGGTWDAVIKGTARVP